jgi:hypothetical protein
LGRRIAANTFKNYLVLGAHLADVPERKQFLTLSGAKLYESYDHFLPFAPNWLR